LGAKRAEEMTAIPDSTAADPQQIIAELERRLDERTLERDESRQQQKATAEVLKVISSSAFDLQAVFETVVESSAGLARADRTRAFIYRLDGELLRLAAAFNAPRELKEFVEQNPVRPGRHSGAARAALERRTIHIPDVMADPEYTFGAKNVETVGTLLAVPILKGDDLLGILLLYLLTVAPFTERQIAQVEAFADQAAIAIENARLFDEVQAKTSDLEESLQQQTATADVLKVISRSAFDLDSVLATLVASAAKLCEAEKGVIFLREENDYRLVSNYGFSAEFEAFAKTNPFPTDGGSTTTRAAESGLAIQVIDVLEDQARSALAREYQRLGGYRTNLAVPLRREGQTIGVFTLTRQVVRAFTQRQIELVETFADQAVIAIENIRLFNEVQARTEDLRESLQQQTATAEVLKAISRSAFDLESVLTTLTVSAKSLCGAASGVIYRREGNLYRYAASHMDVDPAYRAHEQQVAIQADRGTLIGRVALEKGAVQIADAWTDPEYEEKDEARLGNVRAMLGVPLMLSGEPIGAFALARREPMPFSQREVELVTTFADQAVIAIENARLFDEVQRRTRELSVSLEELRTAQDRLVQTEKLASLGQLTAGIAHEIKNPLNFVNNFSALSAELIEEMKDMLSDVSLDKNKREDLDEITQMLKSNLDKVVQHGKRADSIVKNMLLHSRQGSGEHRPVDINAIVDESLNLAYHGARAENTGFNIAMHRSFDPAGGMADGYPQEITRALLNLISNGFYAATKRKADVGDGFEPTLTATTKNLGDKVEIRIRDNGTGIPTEVKEKIFNPFFTTKPAGEGTGLGLSMSHDIVVKQHGGTIDVVSEPGAFTEFRIVLPRAGAALIKSGEEG
jgi:two-component system, NtrC family, sensor kinase